MGINAGELARRLTEVEGGKKQVDIAQMSEIVSKLPEVLNGYPLTDVMEWMLGRNNNTIRGVEISFL